MNKGSINTDARQSVRSLVAAPSDFSGGVARRGTAKKSHSASDRWPRPVTRGHLLQDADVEVSPALAKHGVIDWYAFTLPCDKGIRPSELAADVAGWLPAFIGQMERGMMGYTNGVILPGEGRILWNDDRPDMGVHVELPSKCLKLLEVDAVQLCGWVHLREGQATRVDIALDTDQVHMSQVVEAQNGKCLVSRAQDRRLIYNYRDGSQTLYVGSSQSRRLVRFYDKALEQQSKTGQEHNGIWTRCEVQFRREQANMVSEYIGLGAGLTDVINSCVDFRATWQDSNISRCDRLSWWDEWLGKAEKVSFAVGNVVADVIGQAYMWVQKQVAPTLAFLDRALGVAALDALIDSAKGRIPEYRLRVIAAMGTAT
jgi:hypothetical protein